MSEDGILMVSSELLFRAEDRMAALEAQLRQEREAREHVAWMRYKKRGGSDQSYLVLCDSDAPGAFKVYR